MQLSTRIPFVFEEPAIANNGEDACFTRNAGSGLVAMGVFDGCGGSGSKRYPLAGNRKGAYIGSRAAACAADDYFHRNNLHIENISHTELQKAITSRIMGINEKIAQDDGIQIRGSMSKTMPTTVAIAAMQQRDDNMLSCRFMWAGDSRGYVLDFDGLAQLTIDDINASEEDAFVNIREDGVLTNVANGDSDFILHSGSIVLKKPGMIICATDGCFGYFQTPMYFEYVILDTLLNSSSPAEWERLLCGKIKAVTGDDYTMTVMCFGFSSFSEMKQYFMRRTAFICENYIRSENDITERKTENSLELLGKLWEKYKPGYYRYELFREDM